MFEVTTRSKDGPESRNLAPPYREPRWYAAYTRSRHEKSAALLLERKQIEAFLPLYETAHRWKNGDHQVRLPLFPGYVFVRVPLMHRLEVLKVPGVVRLVGFDGLPSPLDDGEIKSLQHALCGGLKATPHPYLTVGRRVRITAGPLVGREGILVRRKAATQVVLSINLIQRSILVEIDAATLQPLSLEARGR